jgi:drug/metabolite transporter (DMT)-like permease
MPELSRLERSTPFTVGVALMYLVLNTSLNMLNRWALGKYKFRFPMLLTAAHMIFGALMLAPLMFIHNDYRGTHTTNWRRNWKALLFIGAVNGPQIALNNASLISIELSVNQVIRAAIPVCVAAFAFCLERRVPTEIGAAYLLLVTLSVMCVMFTGNEHGEWSGIAMCLTSVLMQSAQMSLSGKLMGGKLDSFQLNFYTGPVAFCVLVLTEACLQQEWRGFQRFATHKPVATVGIMLGGCCLALMYNVVLMQAVRTFSSVGTAVLGNFRTVLVIFASALLLGAAAYGLHPMLFGTPVSRHLPKSFAAEIRDVRKDAVADGVANAEERQGIAASESIERQGDVDEPDEHIAAI